MNRFLSLHALHALPAGCMNRDREGAIKKIPMGGVMRVRVSSQAMKRAMREHMRATAVFDGAFGVRTLRLPLEVAAKVTAAGIDEQVAVAKTAAAMTRLGMKTNPKTGATSAAVHVAADAVDRIAAQVVAHLDQITDKDVPDEVAAAIESAFDVAKARDVAVFGRFLAELPRHTVTSALAAAHPFSVHAAGIEADFFTAVDDLRPDVDTGSGHLGYADLAAPVVYRHIVLDRQQLRTTLTRAGIPDVDAVATTAERAVIDAFVQALPTGKRNGTASTTLPQFVLAVGSGRDTSLANAFTTPIGGPDMLAAATGQLFDVAAQQLRFVTDPTVRLLPVASSAGQLEARDGWAVVDTLDGLVGA